MEELKAEGTHLGRFVALKDAVGSQFHQPVSYSE
jgi:hypothetical protein